MICPICGLGKPGVVNTYGFLDDTIPRVRRCAICKYSFSTTEHIDKDEDFQCRRVDYEKRHVKADA